MDDKLKTDSIKYAIEIFDQILAAKRDPLSNIVGETKSVYQEFVDWDLEDDYDLEKNRGLYIKIIAMQKYRHMKWKIEHPTKEVKKKTKWDKVMGAKRG